MGYLEGFGVTLRQHRLFGGKRLTKNYSGGRMARKELAGRKHGRTPDGLAEPDAHDDVKSPKPDRMHGRHVLNRYEDGMEKCIGCELCAGVCPAKCIYVRGADNDPDDPDLARRALRVRLRDQLPPLHPLRPVRGGLPDRGDHRVQGLRVLVHRTARTPSTPRPSCWSATTAARSTCRGRTGARARTATTSGWVRATAPSGSADFVGLVGWCGELGYGVREPEKPARDTLTLAELPRVPPRHRRVSVVSGASEATSSAIVRVRHRVGDGPRWRARRDRLPAPGARRAQPRADAVRRGRALRRHGGPLPGRRAGHRVRRRDRRAVPVRHHAARRRPGRRPARRAPADPTPAGRRDGRRHRRPARRGDRRRPGTRRRWPSVRASTSRAGSSRTVRSPATMPTSASSPSASSATTSSCSS